MIVLKHLSNEFDIEPYPLRMKLRNKFGIRRRWRWDENSRKDMNELEKIREFLRSSIADNPETR